MAFNKRVAYCYEQEWRAAIYQHPRPGVAGVDIPVELDGLVDEVFVGPKAMDVSRPEGYSPAIE
jgi:hypothetical protein